LLPSVHETVKRVDASLPLRKGQPLPVFVSESTAPERFRAFVLTILTLLGVALAAVGISGVTYRSVVGRTRDFAVRLAIGSAPGRVIRLVLVEALRDVALGAGVGLAGGVALASLLARSLQNIAPVDVVTTAAAVAIIATVGLLAAMVPALRVRRVDPSQVLRG
jgi:ABC-type antimicrobial peptide transport system permease subunit